jgi:hypothetical protein
MDKMLSNYNEYCEKEGYNLKYNSTRTFSKELNKLGYKPKPKPKQINGVQKSYQQINMIELISYICKIFINFFINIPLIKIYKQPHLDNGLGFCGPCIYTNHISYGF